MLRSSLLRLPLRRLYPGIRCLTAALPRPTAVLRQPPLPLPPPYRFFTSAAAPVTKPSLSARLKSLSKEYGYSAVGVYLGLSALDFPFCFLAVRMLGTERIGEWEDTAIGWLKSIYTSTGLPVFWGKHNEGEKDRWDEVEDREEDVERAASIWTELALAYAIHKSFIFLRVPLTAAVTPKVVKVLRGWGWDIGKPGKPTIKMPPRRGTKAKAKAKAKADADAKAEAEAGKAKIEGKRTA